jgi:hypothetical protein
VATFSSCVKELLIIGQLLGSSVCPQEFARDACCRVTFERGSLAEIPNPACQRSNSIAMLEADRVVAIPRIHVIRIPSRNDKPLLCIYIGRALGMSFYRFAER